MVSDFRIKIKSEETSLKETKEQGRPCAVLPESDYLGTGPTAAPGSHLLCSRGCCRWENWMACLCGVCSANGTRPDSAHGGCQGCVVFAVSSQEDRECPCPQRLSGLSGVCRVQSGGREVSVPTEAKSGAHCFLLGKMKLLGTKAGPCCTHSWPW